jgi:signal peptidase I
MTPTLTEKDQVLVKKKTLIQRYDIVAFSVRKEEGMFVKRVIGLPGDKIFIRNERMVLDLGEQGDFETTYTYQLSPTVAGEFQTLNTIPEEVYFVIGDHVDVSKDSRTFGFVHRKAIEGTVQFRFPAIHLARPNNE